MGNGKNSVKHINEVMNQDVVQQINVATNTEAKSKLDISKKLIFIEADPYTGNPDNLLGDVYLVKSKNGKTPISLDDENAVFEKYAAHISCNVDEKSKQNPILRSSIIVDKKLSASVGFLSYLSAELSNNDYYSLMVYDQAIGVVDKTSWTNGLKQWKIDNADLMKDDSVFCIFAITSFVQKM